jgi:putative membrane protein
MKLIIRWLIIAASLVVAAWIVPGIYVDSASAWIAVGVMAIVLGFVNAFIRPLLAMLSCGCIVATMGLFMLVVNAVTLWLSAYITSNWLGIGFRIDGFWPAFWGSIIVSIVSFVLSMFLIDDKERGE